MENKLLRYTLRVDRLIFRKFRYIAESEGRSANKEIEQYLKKRVAEYEKENGKIEVSLDDWVLIISDKNETNNWYWKFEHNRKTHKRSTNICRNQSKAAFREARIACSVYLPRLCIPNWKRQESCNRHWNRCYFKGVECITRLSVRERISETKDVFRKVCMKLCCLW